MISEPKDNGAPRRMRADARQKMTALLEAALEVFAKSGVNAPVREIAQQAGVGLGTVYRHFPQRSDLIVAVLQKGADSCAEAATVLANKYEPDEALLRWIYIFMDLVASKRGLATALQSGDPAYSALPAYFSSRMVPALKGLLEGAAEAKFIRPDIDAYDLLRAIVTLCQGPNEEEPPYARKMVAMLVDGMRYGATDTTTGLPE
ncbi:TetR/AcrR family transcriptional regulator [Cedecea colo]|uniref:TetR/AcrR family transcriptional regulator n=1 Tax=Cedecea colo TaxID=2552946 RepID=A0ABX0VL67_9ENTR|nr:TetR/AcrR family transcriptional regulator [Cedecea colo]NIY47340.1 TetR/AcrR family transcriptional regulator [Cedecea colo]